MQCGYKGKAALKGGLSMNYTYLLECADHTLYCGWTNDLEKRVKAHNSGAGAKYTKPRRPVVLVYYEEFQTKEEAMRRERAIKQLTRQEKLLLIAEKSETNRQEERIEHAEESDAKQAEMESAEKMKIQTGGTNCEA